MATEPGPDERGGFLARLNAGETIVLAVIALVALAGLMLIGKGFFIKAKTELAQVLLKRSFEAELSGESAARPWPWADFGTAAEIAAPRIGRTAIVVEDKGRQALAFGPAHVAGTPQPGEPGTAVIAARRDTAFPWLAEVRPGDTLIVTRKDGTAMRFRAGAGRVGRWDETGIDPGAPGRRLALAACWPLDGNVQCPLRYIVIAELIDDLDVRKFQVSLR